MPRDRRTGRPYLRFRTQVLATGDPCAICGYPINLDLPGRSSWGPSLHHPHTLRWGGALTDGNGTPAHTGCNAAVRDAHPGTPRYVKAVQNRRTKAARLFGQGRGPVPSPSCEW